MTWKIQRVSPNPLQGSVALVNDDNAATPTTDYHKADQLARGVLNSATLSAKGYTLTGKAVRVYVSQAY